MVLFEAWGTPPWEVYSCCKHAPTAQQLDPHRAHKTESSASTYHQTLSASRSLIPSVLEGTDSAARKLLGSLKEVIFRPTEVSNGIQENLQRYHFEERWKLEG